MDKKLYDLFKETYDKFIHDYYERRPIIQEYYLIKANKWGDENAMDK